MMGPGQRRCQAGAQADERDREDLLPVAPPVGGHEAAQQPPGLPIPRVPAESWSREESPSRKKTPSSDWLPA